MRTFGKILYNDLTEDWHIRTLEAHVRMKLKRVFLKVRASQVPPYRFPNTPESCADLDWFMQRYPLEISSGDRARMTKGCKVFAKETRENEKFLKPDYRPQPISFKDGLAARDYQTSFAQLFWRIKRTICGDALGIGKTITAITAMTNPKTLPALVVVQTHMPKHWQEKIEEFTNLRVHFITKSRPDNYKLPVADVYILKYTGLAGWCDYFSMGVIKSVYFDEIQELRREESMRYKAAKTIANYSHVEYVMGLTATPVYNYADELFNVLNVVKPECLGTRDEFLREWGYYRGNNRIIVHDPKALGTYLREQYLFIRRTRKEVGRELPPINKIVHYVDYDEKEVKKSYDIAKALAIKVTEGSYTERGQAARELDMLARMVTGISKARYVAEYVKILLENNVPVLLTGWHRDVYDIWKEEFAEHNPVFYTGKESLNQKEKSKKAFIDGETNLMIISLRSGVGLDGLQHRSSTIVFGELDWSPKIHDQIIARLDRDGQLNQVTAIFLMSDTGSDIPIMELLGLKSSQAHGITDPLEAVAKRHSDDSRIKLLASQYLKGKKKELEIVNK